MNPDPQPQRRGDSEGSDGARYQSYLLRLWSLSPETSWRASLENVTTGNRISFPDVESLIPYLLDATGTEAGSAARQSEPESREQYADPK